MTCVGRLDGSTFGGKASVIAVAWIALAFFLITPGYAHFLASGVFSSEPAVPLAHQPFDVMIAGEGQLGIEFGPPEVVGTVINVRSQCIEFHAHIPLPPLPYEYLHTLDGLPAGEYTLNLILAQDGDCEDILIETWMFQVVEPVTVQGVFVEPPVIGDNDLARLIVAGTSECAAVVLDGVDVHADEIVVSGRVGEATPACTTPVEFAFSADVGPLDPGDYRVRARIVTEDGEVVNNEIGQAALEVVDVPETVVLQDGLFEVDVDWSDHSGSSGVGRPVAGQSSDESALFTFFDRENWEVMVKVIDGCSFNDHWWVFGAAATDVEYTLTVTDTQSGAVWSRTNPLGTRAPAISEIKAFPCSP